MELFDAIENRKSVRRYKVQQISDDDLNVIIKAGCAAPIASAKYEKVFITVVQDKKLMKKMSESVSGYFEKPLKPFYNAPTLVIVSGKKYPSIGFGGRKWKQDDIEIANTACIIENMLLAATALGLGSTYITGFISCFTENPELLTEIQLPSGFIPLGGVLLGYQDGPVRSMKSTKEINVKYFRSNND